MERIVPHKCRLVNGLGGLTTWFLLSVQELPSVLFRRRDCEARLGERRPVVLR